MKPPAGILLALLLAGAASADRPPERLAARGKRQPRYPIARLLVHQVHGLALSPVAGPLALAPGRRIELAAEARDAAGLALEVRPRWKLDRPAAGTLAVNPYNGVATFTAGRVASRCRLEVHDPRAPGVVGRVELRVLGPAAPGLPPRPERLEAYLVCAGRRLRIDAGAAIFARPGTACTIEVLGVFGATRRPVRVDWSLDPRGGTLLPTGTDRVRLVAGYTESPPRQPYRLRIAYHGDERIERSVPLVIER